ncbi:MAG TPA: urate hydroxylase PuuD [Kofleriaceae bacterium]|nr:urate hydroxylase PuuD [Kofleriaceae bacterium]
MSLNQLLDVVFRWAHLIAGIMWIGNSMLFNWLDRNLIAPPADDEHRLSQGTIHMVHSGAFYEVEKKLLAPNELPDQLHWFKWQNGITWLTGISLLIVVYYWNGYLVDPSVMKLAPSVAISISAGSLLVAWIAYDALWYALGDRPRLASFLSLAGLFVSAFVFTQIFGGRAAYIQTGVLIGTIMTGNVWLVILPSQKELIAATKQGREQDKTLSLRAKQRSIHNNYLTFPLLFIMLSNHFDATYGAWLNWAALFVVMVGGAGVRHFMNIRYAGARWLGPALAIGVLSLFGVMMITRVRKPVVEVKNSVDFARAEEIIQKRCVPCHSPHPSDSMFSSPPNNVMFDTPDRIEAMVPRIKERAVVNQTMPFLNRTNITDEERAELGKWIDEGAKLQ